MTKEENIKMDNVDQNSSPVLISPKTGMLDYPSWSPVGLKVKTLLGNNEFHVGERVQIQCSTMPTIETWIVNKVEYDEWTQPNGEVARFAVLDVRIAKRGDIFQ